MPNLFFTPQQMAQITNGYWENLDPSLQIRELHHTFKYLQEGDMFIVISSNWPKSKGYKTNEDKIHEAINKSVHALMLKNDVTILDNIPILRVENTYEAIKALAQYASLHSHAKKILISGSYGKTGCKTHLYHLLSSTYVTYTRFNSANYSASNYCYLASVQKETELLLMEIPIAKRKKMIFRASLVSPDIAIITSIGHEGIERWKNIDRIIRYKLLIASGMKNGGRLLLPFDDVYYKKLLQEAQKYENIELLTYGSHSSCNAYIVEKYFNNFGWDVVAKIEGRLVAYHVPFFEEYALNASLCELLCAYHLGADIYGCADRYYGCTNFKSSGLFYKVTLGAKKFYLYDQSNRGGIEGYESFFKTLCYLTPPNKGQKILLTSEFVDYKDGEMAFIDTALFQKLISASGISQLYSVEKFSEHINVLEDKSIWKNHSIDFHNIKDEILHAIQNDTLFCVKGIFNSSLPKFVTYLKNLPDIKFEKIEHLNTMQEKNKLFKEQRHD